MSKRFKKLRTEAAELPVHDASKSTELPELRKEDEEELKKAVAEADASDDKAADKKIEEDGGVGLPADSKTSKQELPEGEEKDGKEDELKKEDCADDKDAKMEDDSDKDEEDFEVDLSDLEEDDAEAGDNETVKKEAAEDDAEDKKDADDKDVKKEAEGDDDKMAKLRDLKKEDADKAADDDKDAKKDDEKVAVEAADKVLDGEDVPEKLKEKARTVIEATVNTLVEKRLKAKNAKLKGAYLGKLKEIKTKTEASYANKLDKYTNYVVENWMNENKIAVESGIKVELAESFFASIKTLLEKNSVVIPSGKETLVEEQAKKISELNEALETQISAYQTLQEKVGSFEKEKAIDDASGDLSLEQKTRLRKICENVSFENAEKFAKKVTVLKETYLVSKAVAAKAKDLDAGIVDEGGIKNADIQAEGKYADVINFISKQKR